MTFKNLYFTLGFSISLATALVACNKSSEDKSAPPPSAAALPNLVPQIVPSSAFPRIRDNRVYSTPRYREYAQVSCVSTATDLSGRSGILDIQPYYFSYPWDTSKAETINIPQRFSAVFGNITLKIQPHNIDSNSNITAEGYMELLVSGVDGNSSAVIRTTLDSNIKLEIDDDYREANFSVDCNIVELVNPAQSKSSYLCQSGNAIAQQPQQVQAQGATPLSGTIKDFKINSKPEFFDSNKSLKLEVDKSHDIERLVLTVVKNQNRKIKMSVPFGHDFVARSGSSSANATVDCLASVNATQQDKKK